MSYYQIIIMHELVFIFLSLSMYKVPYELPMPEKYLFGII